MRQSLESLYPKRTPPENRAKPCAFFSVGWLTDEGFHDQDHMNRAGAEVFSKRLGSEVAGILGRDTNTNRKSAFPSTARGSSRAGPAPCLGTGSCSLARGVRPGS